MLLLLDTLPVAGAHGVSGLTRGLWYTSKPLWCRRTMASHVRCFQSALGEDGIPWVAKGFPKFEGEVRVDFGSRVSFKRLPHVFLRWGLKKQAATVKCCWSFWRFFSFNQKKTHEVLGPRLSDSDTEDPRRGCLRGGWGWGWSFKGLVEKE